MTALPGARIPTAVESEVKASSSPVTVTQSVVHQVADTVSKAIADAAKTVADAAPEEPKKTVAEEVQVVQQMQGRIYNIDPSQPLYDDDSHVFVYFMLAMLLCAFGYMVFHNKRKIFALIIEGRQSHGDVRRSGGVNYKRLNTEPPGVSVA